MQIFQILIDVVFFLAQSLVFALIVSVLIVTAQTREAGNLFAGVFLLAVATLLFFPVGMIRYRLWKNLRYWALWLLIFVGGILIFSIVHTNEGSAAVLNSLGSSAVSAGLLSVLLATPLWQLITFISWGIRMIRTR